MSPGIDGVTVTLTIDYPNGTTITLLTLTGDNPSTPATEMGWYSFCNLLADEDYSSGSGAATPSVNAPAFVISVSDPAGYTRTLVDATGAGISDLNDSDDHDGVATTPSQGDQTVVQQGDATTESDPDCYV